MEALATHVIALTASPGELEGKTIRCSIEDEQRCGAK
eukprot:symbB.v1.2.037036.t1/scaffold5364.1/size27975/1